MRIKADELETGPLNVKGLELSIGKVVEKWEEEPGPTPMPDIAALREWDHKLLKKYKHILLKKHSLSE